MLTFKRATLGASMAAAVLWGLPAWAADSGTVQVSATVQGICKLTATPDMSWGTPGIDPTGTADATATSTIKYRCTKGTSAGTFSVGSSNTGTYSGTLAGQLATAPDSMAYTITWSTNYTGFSGAGFAGSAAEGSILLTGTITSAVYSAVKADTYKETVAVSITP